MGHITNMTVDHDNFYGNLKCRWYESKVGWENDNMGVFLHWKELHGVISLAYIWRDNEVAFPLWSPEFTEVVSVVARR